MYIWVICNGNGYGFLLIKCAGLLHIISSHVFMVYACVCCLLLKQFHVDGNALSLAFLFFFVSSFFIILWYFSVWTYGLVFPFCTFFWENRTHTYVPMSSNQTHNNSLSNGATYTTTEHTTLSYSWRIIALVDRKHFYWIGRVGGVFTWVCKCVCFCEIENEDHASKNWIRVCFLWQVSFEMWIIMMVMT